MALVKFLQGPVDNLPQEISNGSIYFTTDEGKLYIDTEDGERIEINAKGAEGLIRDGEFIETEEVYRYIDNAISNVTINMDEAPIAQSENAVKSGGVFEALGKKQDALTGAQGQVVGFDDSGKAVAQDAPESGVNDGTASNITGLIKGDGESVSAAVAGEDYLPAAEPVFTGTMTGPSIEIIPSSKTKVLQKPIALSLANDGTTMSITDNYNGIFIDTTSNIVWVGSSSTAIGIDNGRLVFRFDGENSQASLILMDMGSGITISGIVMPPGNNIYAATNKKYVDDTVKQSVTSYLATLYANNWSNNTQSIEAPNVIGDELTQEVRICPATIDIDTYIDFGIRAINVTSGGIRFKCDSVPTSNIDIFINTQTVTPVEV